ncbi:MAG: HEPN domain-containing protein [Gammaproteobacteria bacterium]|nr:HEPN domain-containing protein [Gammaproteobacteria bacterium]
MSYTSESVLSKDTRLNQVREVINLLGYQKVDDGLKVPNRTDCMMWVEDVDYKSWVGVELDIYRENGQITVSTRSRAGRSYWDLTHQNKTLKLLKDMFGGHFETDAGRNRYWRPEGKPPSHMSSGCFLARWRFNNALIKPRLYLMQRGLDQQNARPQPSGLEILDQMNPRLFSNNLLLPYLIAIWEEYFKSTFVALMKYSEHRESALKRAKLSQSQLEAIASGYQGVEQAFSESLSFQRPSNVGNNFKLIDPKLDIAAALRKPYRRRKISLYESIEKVVELRNNFVHAGEMDTGMTDKAIEKVINDIEVAIDRAYDTIGKHYKFSPIRDF